MKKSLFKDRLALLNKHIRRHYILMIIASSIISLVALLFVIYWQFDENNINPTVDNIYLVGNIFFLVISTLLTGVLVLQKFVEFKTNALAILIHIYFFLLLAWGTVVCVLDLRYGFSPLFYLMIFSVCAGLFIVEPLFFSVTFLASIITIFSLAFKDHAAFFSGEKGVENLVTFVIYLIVIVLAANEHLGMMISNNRYEKKLEDLSYIDDLTGLLNERSYIKEIEELDKKIESGELKDYAVILFDLNNLKATNDQYGHRYGCHLVVRAGHTLPEFFTSSSVFHIGGDEYLAIVYKEDYENLDVVMQNIEEKLSYSLIEYEGQTLIFSIAHGYARHEDGQKYKDVLQVADKRMYANKEMLKSKYGMAKR